MTLIANKATNDPIAASWANQIRDQTIQVTLSSARPSSPTEGFTIWETDTNRLMVYDGSAWRMVWPASTLTRADLGAVTTTGTTASLLEGGSGITVAALNVPYKLRVKATVFHTQTVATDAFGLQVFVGAGITAQSRGQAVVETLQVEDVISVPAGGATTFFVRLQRINGSGTASTFSDSTANFCTYEVLAA